ncbi:hypothetical protein AZF04_10115 [Alkalihalobacillus trypoxylicola]|uniref:Uncharacterized protein n=1 Tax=Alkalihalobacillus trypoxylicola TaxID=519424 RepID=A0A161P9K4_9BACI|nr:hypothetical protein AZF04_10115 [Alkalihalobacillus trypoxylicola]
MGKHLPIVKIKNLIGRFSLKVRNDEMDSKFFEKFFLDKLALLFIIRRGSLFVSSPIKVRSCIDIHAA